ncbi:hypothetical protein CPB86DRAFT_828699 [Serendipita vermifera]|nr:hypothetical protein CPB86DRAFT_828699 [Serendipita vermifera]
MDKARQLAAENTILIAVVGPTGSGKSTFVNVASGSTLRVGDGLESCTQDIQASNPFMLDGKQIVLFDTPGFDDSNLDDVEILRRVAVYLSTIYQKGKKLSGILYFHRICDFRMNGISVKNFRMFSELCGEEAMKNVAIVTNMWELVIQRAGEARETQLKTTTNFFGAAIAAGARMVRHENNSKSAQDILRSLIPNVPEPLRIQKETADQNLELHQTSAGKVLRKEQEELIRSHQQEIRSLTEKMSKENEDQRKEMNDRVTKLASQMNAAQEDAAALQRSWETEKRRLQQTIDDLEKKTDNGWC